MNLFYTVLLSLAVLLAGSANADDMQDPEAVLDALHREAAEADWAAYFALFSEDAIFIGTDASEVWTIDVFKTYAEKAKNGWAYTKTERQVRYTPDGQTAYFHELLVNKKYGQARGTGVLIRTPGGWRIAQYHLTFPIPNALAEKVTKEISEHSY